MIESLFKDWIGGYTMNTRILLIRHAQSIANENGMFGGITDYPLSKSGQAQANSLAKKLEKYEIKKIYSSPLKRAIQTISPSAKFFNKEILIDDNLIEMNVGTWENQLRDELRKKYPETNKYIDETEYYTGMEGQEDTAHVADRMFKAVTKIAKENKGKTIVIVSHYVAINAFLCKIMNIPFEQTKLKIGGIKNTGITEIECDIENSTFNVIKIGSMD